MQNPPAIQINNPVIALKTAIESAWLPLIQAMVKGNLSVRQAAISTGLSVPPPDLMQTDVWKNIVMREQAIWRQALNIDRRDIVDGMLEAINLAMAVEDAGAAVRGWSEIAKMCGLYQNTRTETAVSTDNTKALEHLHKLSDAELITLMEQP